MKGNLIGNYMITGTEEELRAIIHELGEHHLCGTVPTKFDHLKIDRAPGLFRVRCATGPIPDGWGKASISLLPWRTTYLPSGREHRAECVLDAAEFCEILDAKKFNLIPTRDTYPSN